MAGSEQRPTDEVLGHGNKAPEDDTAADDRGKRNPDDVEGHMPWRRLDSEATHEDQVGDDTEGHMPFRRLDTEAVDEDQAADDTEGHAGRYGG